MRISDWSSDVCSSDFAELLMMERSRKMDFAAGALVFPGGAVDEADAGLAAAHGGGLAVDEAAARIAAIRETLEESGLVLGLRNCPDADLACQIRERMKQGESFAALLGEYGLRSEEHKSVGEGKSVLVRVELGGRRLIKKT